MSRVFWDTNLFIYLFEDYREFSRHAAELRNKMLARGDQLFTSTMTLGEILVKPMQAGDADLCHRYESAIIASAVVLPFDVAAARKYAGMRSNRSLRAPDALQLACAAAAGMDLFVTNDARLQGVNVPGIQFIVPLARVPI
jgi:predicted nucleic acid-binding protein